MGEERGSEALLERCSRRPKRDVRSEVERNPLECPIGTCLGLLGFGLFTEASHFKK